MCVFSPRTRRWYGHQCLHPCRHTHTHTYTHTSHAICARVYGSRPSEQVIKNSPVMTLCSYAVETAKNCHNTWYPSAGLLVFVKSVQHYQYVCVASMEPNYDAHHVQEIDATLTEVLELTLALISNHTNVIPSSPNWHFKKLSINVLYIFEIFNHL